MANIKSAKKRILITEKQTARNKAIKTGLKNKIKNFDAAVAGDDLNAANEALVNAQSSLDRAANKGIIHKNKANRKKARMAVALNKGLETRG